MLRDFRPGSAVIARAVEFASGAITAPPVTPRPSSTVMLLRDGEHGVEVFVVRRAATMAFAAQMHAFPGGGVDPRDGDPDLPWAGPTPQRWATTLGVTQTRARELVCAAVRELFEECGVLLAGADGDAVVADLSDPSWERDRQALLDRSLPLGQLLRRRGLVLRTDLLRAWSHWTTPVFQPRRYDTRFFAAALPAGQGARDVGGEADRAGWVRAAAAVDEYHVGALAMLPPTIVTLEELARAHEVTAVLAQPRSTSRAMPWLVARAAPGAEPSARSFLLRVDVDGRGGGRPGPEHGLERIPADAPTYEEVS